MNTFSLKSAHMMAQYQESGLHIEKNLLLMILMLSKVATFVQYFSLIAFLKNLCKCWYTQEL